MADRTVSRAEVRDRNEGGDEGVGLGLATRGFKVRLRRVGFGNRVSIRVRVTVTVAVAVRTRIRARTRRLFRGLPVQPCFNPYF